MLFFYAILYTIKYSTYHVACRTMKASTGTQKTTFDRRKKETDMTTITEKSEAGKAAFQQELMFPIGEKNPYGKFFDGQSYLAAVCSYVHHITMSLTIFSYRCGFALPIGLM